MPEEAAFLPTGPDVAAPRPTRPRAAGRLVVGTLVALGAYLGLRKFLAGWAAAAATDPNGWWRSDDGLAAVFAAQLAATAFGAVLVGAGRARAVWLGGAVGALCGGLFLAAEVASGVPPESWTLLVQPAALATAGAIAGAVGGRVWGGLPELDMPAPAVRRSGSSVHLDAVTPKAAGRPTLWLRVLVGACVATAGVALADPFRRAAEKSSQGALRAASMGQARFLSAQMATLAVLAGGAAAAAGTGAGVRHGLLAGLFGAAGVIGVTAWRGALPVPAVYLIEHMGLDPNAAADPGVLTAVAFGLVVAGVVGGWLGGTLFLPLAPAHLRGKRLRLGMD